MMGKLTTQKYELFFAELPKIDFFNDIEIQDEYGDPPGDPHGLSDEQVLEIARDSLRSIKRQTKPTPRFKKI